MARLGDSFVLAATQYGGAEIATVRGTAKRKLQTPEQAGCKEGEVQKSYGPSERPAITPEVIESTPDGSLVSIGLLCGDRGSPAAEVWDKAGKSRIIDLTRWWKKVSYWPKLLKGIGDELWAISDSWAPILHFRNGAFEAVADLERPNRNLFVSPSGKLHANDGRTLHRYEGGKWIPIGHLAVPADFAAMAMDDKETIWVAGGGVHRLRPTPTPAAAVPEGCSTPICVSL